MVSHLYESHITAAVGPWGPLILAIAYQDNFFSCDQMTDLGEASNTSKTGKLRAIQIFPLRKTKIEVFDLKANNYNCYKLHCIDHLEYV